MYQGAIYIHAQHIALERFTGLSRPKLAIIQQLIYFNKPATYTLLYDQLSVDCVTIAKRIFNEALHDLVGKGIIERRNITYFTFYSITLQGRLLYDQFNRQLDCIVKEQIIKYGNGFNPE
jgi:predicted transcriptional regulator